MATRYVLLKQFEKFSYYDTVILGVFDDFDTVARIRDEQYASEEGNVFIIKVEANRLYSDHKGHELCKTPLEMQRDEERLREQQVAEDRQRRKMEVEAMREQEMARKIEEVRRNLEQYTDGRCVFSTDVQSDVMRHVVDCYDEVQFGSQRCGDEFWDAKEEAHKKRMRWYAERMELYQRLYLKSPQDINAFKEFKSWFESHMID